jgi:hypothetical protein
MVDGLLSEEITYSYRHGDGIIFCAIGVCGAKSCFPNNWLRSEVRTFSSRLSCHGHIVAVTSGVVDEVTAVDKFSWKTDLGSLRGGLSVSIVGDDGVRYYGSHLSKIAPGIKPGVRVSVGQLLGLLGNSGDAKGTAPHVHFGISWPTPAKIWWVRRGELYPWRYLDAWKVGKDLSPAKSVVALETKLGKIPKHTGY